MEINPISFIQKSNFQIRNWNKKEENKFNGLHGWSV
jgi:hypothetical protein